MSSKSALAGERVRTSQACEQCRSHKVKCTGSLPCQRCSTRDQACSYTSKETQENSIHLNVSLDPFANSSTAEVANSDSLSDQVHQTHGLELSETGDVEMTYDSISNGQASASLQSLAQPPNLASFPSTQNPTVFSSTAETLECPVQQPGVDTVTDGSQWMDCNGFEDFDTTQIGLLSPLSLNQWQHDFYEPSTSINPWITSSQVLLSTIHRYFVLSNYFSSSIHSF